MLLALALLASIDMTAAQRALSELDAMCNADRGALWGRSLCGPTVLVEPATRDAVTSIDGRIAAAHLPDSIGIANTSVTWNGVEFTMVMWPLPDDPLARRTLLAHESFHRIQKELGFPSTGPSNTHLDSVDGRYWLRLEWRALARALETGDRRAVSDALAFRAKRRAITKSAAEEERLLEMHEGLAEHTGFALAEPRLGERSKAIAKQLRSMEMRESFVRSFAYGSGPAWGAVIEKRDPHWTRKATASDDLGALARKAWNVAAQAPRLALYDAAAVRA
ncbi:MAG TPA: hypothetical protein VN181_00765, partial [Thermoanaerobaculia bacterium]|nr:hypothetical protein [Thermoanaerobaculia bacterium]